jgi:hypothetical protein
LAERRFQVAKELRFKKAPNKPVQEPAKKPATGPTKRPSELTKKDRQEAARREEHVRLTLKAFKEQVFDNIEGGAESAIAFREAIERSSAAAQLFAKQSRQDYYRVLSAAYLAHETLLGFDEEEKAPIVQWLARQMPRSSRGSRMRVPDPFTLLLHQYIAYPTEAGKGARDISRDRAALNYARDHGIGPSEFVAEISKKGEGLDVWSRRTAKKRSKQTTTRAELEEGVDLEGREPAREPTDKWKNLPLSYATGYQGAYDGPGIYIDIVSIDDELDDEGKIHSVLKMSDGCKAFTDLTGIQKAISEFVQEYFGRY